MKILKKEKGQSMVEFAIILPILLLLLGPIVDLGRTVYAKTQLQNITGDLMHMVILENEYSYQGGSFKALEDKIISEDFGMPSDYLSPEEKEGYVVDKIFKQFIKTEGLDNGLIDMNNVNNYITIGPIKKGFDHKGHYPKLKKKLPGGLLIDESENVYGHDGYDEYGLDKLGYNRNGNDINGIPVEHPYADRDKHKRWQLDEGFKSVENSTYYREVSITLPYEVENITITGKLLFGETTKLEETVSGIIYMGGDGRDVTDPIS